MKTPSLIALLFLAGSLSTTALGRGEKACTSAILTATPTRPVVANSTTTTQCGVIEGDYGLAGVFPGNGSHDEYLSGSLRIGLTPRMDFRWGGDSIHITSANQNTAAGTGDNWLGLRYRFTDQKQSWVSLGAIYSAKLPTANAHKGLGTGQVDHSMALLASKDLGHWHADFNVIPAWVGRSGRDGFDRNAILALDISHPLNSKWSLTSESWGQTELNSTTPAFASNLFVVAYAASSRMVFDAGVDVGLTSAAPRGRLVLGMTYSIDNLYSHFGGAK